MANDSFPQSVIEAFERQVSEHRISEDAAIVPTIENESGANVWVVLDHTFDMLLKLVAGTDIAPVGIINQDGVFESGDAYDIIENYLPPAGDVPMFLYGVGVVEDEVSA